VTSGGAINTNFIVYVLTLLGLEPTIYHTLGEHANDYHMVTDVVLTTIIVAVICF